MRKIVIVLLLIALGGIGGYFITSQLFSGFFEDKQKHSVEVVLNEIRQVSKLVTVEGGFSEIYTFDEFWGVDLYPFKKKALVRVDAQVLVGYDLKNMTASIDEKNKVIILSNIPPPEIMSVDKKVDYYDIQEGAFNQFEESDFTAIDKRVDTYIRSVAKESDLFNKAEEQLKAIIKSISILAYDAGYTISWKEEIEKNSFD